jgi:hypothetical protein
MTREVRHLQSLAEVPGSTNANITVLVTRSPITGRQQLLQALTTGIASAGRDEQFAFYLSFLQHQLSKTRFQNAVIEKINGSADPDNAVLSAMAALAELIQHESHLSLGQIVHRLVDDGVFSKHSTADAYYSTAFQAVFVFTGWLTTLYSPVLNGPSNILHIEQESSSIFESPRQTIGASETVSLDLFLHGFGSVLPRKVHSNFTGPGSPPVLASQPPPDDVLRVALFNAAHLKRIKKARIEWTLSIGTHLDFDKSTKCLRIFCMPSILLLQIQSTNSPLSQ